MLAALVGSQVAAGLLCRGAWDLWAQSAVLLALIAGLASWAAAGAVRGRLRLPGALPARWALALAVLSFASAWASPVRAYALPAWAAGVAGLWLIPAASMLSERERIAVEEAVRAAAWMLVLLAFYQRIHGFPRPAAAFPNQNVFAGAILLLLPFATRRGDPLLAAGLVICLWWTRSVGAWLGLSVALAVNRRSVGNAAFWAGAAAGLAGLVAAYARLESPEVLHRVEWWRAAWRMAADAPWLGLGPAAFERAFSAYAPTKPDLSSLFAHQHLLETAAERGWPYLILWCAGLAALLRRAGPSRRFGPVAALVHGLVDYPLSLPGVFWLFCLSAGWSLPESDRAVAVPAGRKAPVALGFAVAGFAAFVWTADTWRADRLRAKVVAESATTTVAEADRLLAASEGLRAHPETARLRAELARVRAGRDDAKPRLEEAAVELERAVKLDPYRLSSWLLLEDTYRRLGRVGDAAGAIERGARTCPSLRAGDA